MFILECYDECYNKNSFKCFCIPDMKLQNIIKYLTEKIHHTTLYNFLNLLKTSV